MTIDLRQLPLALQESFSDKDSYANFGRRTQQILVPVLAPTKGSLYDAENIVDQRGYRVPALSTANMAQLHVALLINLVSLTYDLNADVRTWEAKYTWHLYDLVDIALRAKSSGYKIETAYWIMAGFAAENSPDEAFFRKLQLLVFTLCRRYIVAVQIDPGRISSLTYKHQVLTDRVNLPVRPTTTTKRIISKLRFLEQVLRIPSGYVRLPVRIGAHCQSYHLHIDLPPNSYTRNPSLRFDGKSVAIRPTQPKLSVSTPYLRADVSFSSSVHVYGRGLDKLFKADASQLDRLALEADVDKSPSIQFRVYETPWATQFIGFAIWAGLEIAVFLLHAAYLRDADSDLLAALIGLPVAVITILIAYQQASTRTVTTSLAGAITTLLGLFAVIGLTSMFGIVSSSVPREVDANAWQPGMQVWQWTIPAVSTIFIATFGAFVLRLARYTWPIE